MIIRVDGETLAVDGSGSEAAVGEGTPPIMELGVDQAETPEETYQRLGIPFGDEESSGSEEETEEEGEETEEVEEPEAEVDDEDEDEPEEEDATDWTAVLRDAPQRINEVSVKQRGEMIKQLLEAEQQTANARVRQVEEQAREQFNTWKVAWTRMSEYARNVDELRETDPDRFREWEQKEPKNAAAYYRWKADNYGEPTPQQQPQQQQAQNGLQAVLQPYIQAINGRQDILDELARRDPDNTRYVQTPKGVAAFMRDVDELLEKGVASAESRKQAAETRKKKPKADPTPSGGGKGKLTQAQLRKMTSDQIAALPMEQLEEAMASSS